jgi:hypothetical protein
MAASQRTYRSGSSSDYWATALRPKSIDTTTKSKEKDYLGAHQ